jgi:hypothetical protein
MQVGHHVVGCGTSSSLLTKVVDRLERLRLASIRQVPPMFTLEIRRLTTRQRLLVQLWQKIPHRRVVQGDWRIQLCLLDGLCNLGQLLVYNTQGILVAFGRDENVVKDGPRRLVPLIRGGWHKAFPKVLRHDERIVFPDAEEQSEPNTYDRTQEESEKDLDVLSSRRRTASSTPPESSPSSCPARECLETIHASPGKPCCLLTSATSGSSF